MPGQKPWQEAKFVLLGHTAIVSWGTTECYEHPLLKFADVNKRSLESHLPDTTSQGEIINVTSPCSISAVLNHPLTKEQISRDNAAVRKSAPKEDRRRAP
jgi:hypothetical protein